MTRPRATVGSYEIDGEIGRGGMGRVYRVRDRRTNVTLALKVLDGASDADGLARFRREIDALSRVGPEGVVPIRDVGSDQGRLYYVMDLMPGGSLRERLASQGRVPWRTAAQLVAALARTLDRCHGVGVVHRDLKPGNILFDELGRPRLADFGCARDLTVDSLTATGMSVGTPLYMAPESLSGKKTDRRADVFGLGLLLHELVTGARPFAGASWNDLLSSMQSGKRPALFDVPRELEGTVAKALAFDPARRHATAGELAAELEVLAAPSAPSAEIAVPPRRVPRWAVLLLSFGVTTLTIVPWLVLAHDRLVPPPPPPPPAPAPGSKLPERTVPAWFAAIPEGERPRLPLPPGLSFGARAGDYVNDRDGSVLVYVPGGPCVIGSNDGDANEKPRHEVVLSPFFVGKLEVTRARFETFVRATGWVTPAELKAPTIVTQESGQTRNRRDASWRRPTGDLPAEPDHPVSQVAWTDAIAYAAWAGLRIPTEAQWEKAATWDPKEAKPRLMPWGSTLPGEGTPIFANLGDESLRSWGRQQIWKKYDDGYPRTAPVGSFPAGASPCGALDMVGNVAEWCEDAYFIYDAAPPLPRENPRRDPATGEERIIRGGSWFSEDGFQRASMRFTCPVSLTSDLVGFRVALPVADDLPALNGTSLPK